MSYTELETGYQDIKKESWNVYYFTDQDLKVLKPRGNIVDSGEEDFSEDEGKQVVVGICAMAKKSQSKPMKEILTRLEEFEFIKIIVFKEEVILKSPIEEWPICDCLISFHSKGFPLERAIQYSKLRNPFIINNLPMQFDIQDRRKVYSLLENEGIEIPRYAVLDRDSPDPKHHELVESEDHVEVNGVVFNKPFVEKPVSAEDHNIYIYYPTSAGGGSQRLFRKIGSRSSVYSPESRVRKTGSFIYEDFMPTDGTDVKVYTVGPDYAHAEARKSPALDGKVERDSEGKEIRYPVILSNVEKLISRKVCLAFKQAVCGFDLLRANGKSFVCDVNGFSFVKNSNKYYDDCAKILGNMILRELAPTLHIPWSVPFQLDDPPIVPTTFGKMMELRCVVAVIRHGDRTPKQKMKVEVRHPKFFEIFERYGGRRDGHVKLKRPKQLQEILDITRALLCEIELRSADPEIEEKQGKLEQLKSVLEMYGHFSGINRKVQLKYQPKGRPRGSSSEGDEDPGVVKEPSLVLILKWGGELTPAGRVQAEELGRIFRCMYPGGQGRHVSGGSSDGPGTQGLGLLRLHSTYRHDLKIYASDEGRVQMTAAAFAKGLLALEGELTPILVQMVKSANTNGLLDNDSDASKHQNIVKARLHDLMQKDRNFTEEDKARINPCNSLSIATAMEFVKNPVKCCERVQELIQKLMNIVRTKKDDPKTKDAILYHGETWELMGRRWGKIEKDFCTKNNKFDISKIPDIYDCIKYDLQHNQHTLQFDQAEELYINAKYLADIVIPQEYGLTVQEKLTISQGICTPLLKKIKADLQRNIEEAGDETVNRLNPRYSHGVSSPGRHVRTRLYFTSESHVHSLLTVLRYGGLLDSMKDEQWRRAMQYVSMVSELNYMSQIVVMLYEDPTKDPSSEERFHVELHFSPGVNCCVQKNLPPGPGFRPHSRNDQLKNNLPPIDQDEMELNSMSTDERGSPTPSDTDIEGEAFNSSDNEKKGDNEGSGFRSKIKASDPIPISSQTNVSLTDRASNSRTNEEATGFTMRLNDKQIPEVPLTGQSEESHKKVFEVEEPEQRSRSYDHSRNSESHNSVTESEYFTPETCSFLSEYEMRCAVAKYDPPAACMPLNDLVAKYEKDHRIDARPHSSNEINLKVKNSPIVLTTTNYTPSRHRLSSLDDSSMQFVLVKKAMPQVVNAGSDKVDLVSSTSAIKTDLQSLDLAHVEVISHQMRKIQFPTSASIKSSSAKSKSPKTTRIPLKHLKSRSLENSRSPSNFIQLQLPDEAGSRRHRHSISGQTNHFRVLGASCGTVLSHPGNRGPISGSGSSLFSTAVISGSSSAPNLRDMITNAASIAAIDGCGGVPAIRPLETLHNALSLKKLDTFLDYMTRVMIFRTPGSSPPKHPSTPLPSIDNLANLKLQSPESIDLLESCMQQLSNYSNEFSSEGFGWSGPPSLVSSSEASSPVNIPDFYLKDGFSKTSDGTSESERLPHTYFDVDAFSSTDLMSDNYYGHRDSIEIADLYVPNKKSDFDNETIETMRSTAIHHAQLNTILYSQSPSIPHLDHDKYEGSGELTPVSSSELKFNWSDSEVNNESDNDMMHLEANEEEKTLTSTMKETDQLKAALKAHIEAQNKLSSQVCADGTSAGTINEVVSASGEPLERTEPDIAVGSSKKCEKVSRFRVDFPQYDTTSQASALPDSNASSDKES
ncbi:inositol hexakisphosphate and diphosphoinositol-pentakisphosphate kinase 2 isoform X2 [Bemisia tabaci]|uniref:inositol hexakisphosphate and diphosphoinositol-pentakisphosphate kinase 2 isoform X2 n=1 Tax=Bemisia tabaci TaxID=7038 RepID=UPI003B27BF6B